MLELSKDGIASSAAWQLPPRNDARGKRRMTVLCQYVVSLI
jgi:hypothetical protein